MESPGLRPQSPGFSRIFSKPPDFFVLGVGRSAFFFKRKKINATFVVGLTEAFIAVYYKFVLGTDSICFVLFS